MGCEVSAKTILKRSRQEILSKAVERGQKVSHFLISLSIVSSNGYSMTAEHVSISFFAPGTIVARFQHISQACHRWRGIHPLEFVLVNAWSGGRRGDQSRLRVFRSP